jgi:hypothetical protein
MHMHANNAFQDSETLISQHLEIDHSSMYAKSIRSTAIYKKKSWCFPCDHQICKNLRLFYIFPALVRCHKTNASNRTCIKFPVLLWRLYYGTEEIIHTNFPLPVICSLEMVLWKLTVVGTMDPVFFLLLQSLLLLCTFSHSLGIPSHMVLWKKIYNINSVKNKAMK